jgi:hypothetical protein
MIGASAGENDLAGAFITGVAFAAGCIFYVTVENQLSCIFHERGRALPEAIPVPEV